MRLILAISLPFLRCKGIVRNSHTHTMAAFGTSFPMTEKLYLKDTYLFNTEAKVYGVSKEESGVAVVLDRSIFHPQGGGQPSDVVSILMLLDFKLCQYPCAILTPPPFPTTTKKIVLYVCTYLNFFSSCIMRCIFSYKMKLMHVVYCSFHATFRV